VAISAHGRAELERALLGSVSLHTALAAPCDVLLLRADAA
jgi:nucleotide-binding universal stress UspA family protein